MLRRISSFLLRHEFIVLVVCIVTLLRIPSLYEPYWYGDEGIYLTLGQGIRQGEQLYRDIHDNKPPVIYIVAAIAGSQFWFRFLLMLCVAASIITFAALAKLWLHDPRQRSTIPFAGQAFPNPLTAPNLAILAFALLPFLAEWNIANGEIFMIFPTLIGMYLLSLMVRERQTTWWYPLLAGLAFSIAFLIKVPAAFDMAAAGLVFFIIAKLRGLQSVSATKILQTIKSIVLTKEVYIFIAAFFVPIALTIVYYGLLGAGQQYVRGAFAQNIGYLSSWQTGTHASAQLEKTGLFSRGIGLVVAMLGLTLAAFVLPFSGIFALVWFAAALFGALLSERPYPHYLIQVIPPGALLIGLIRLRIQTMFAATKKIQVLMTTGELALIATALVVLIYSLVSIRFWYYPLTPYYRNFILYITGKQDKDTYFRFFDPSIPDLYATAQLVVQRTSKADRIFVWGDVPTLYALTRRIPPGRYTSSYHITDFQGFDETMLSIDRSPPRLIIVDTAYTAPFASLQALIQKEYQLYQTIGRFAIYTRIAP